jgi:S-adenosylmethionine-diacylglycerol 3-amino-3-carboxypropyl transferase
MQSEFATIALNQVRYSLVWEDSRTLYEALNIGPADHVLVVTSAGCNVLNALLANPRHVTAIDLNPVQNALLRLKCHLIAHHGPGPLRALMGFDGPRPVAGAWQQVAATLPVDMREYWEPFFAAHPAGLLPAGKLESYLAGFLPSLPVAAQAKFRQLLEFNTVAGQRAFFAAELDEPTFRDAFVAYFDEVNLSKGRDPALFRYALESGGATFYARLQQFIGTKLVRDNFFFRFFFFGPENLPEALLPPCYQQHNHARLQQLLPKLSIVTGEAVAYLNTPAGRTVTKASLSNIFEYTSAAEFRRVCADLLAPSGRSLRLVFWNLLLDQGAAGPGRRPLSAAAQARLSREDGCFYFRNVRVLASQPAVVPVAHSSTFLTPYSV